MDFQSCLIDMDGVLVHGARAIDGAGEFIERLRAKGIKFLVMTNNPMFTPGDLAHRLQETGIHIQKEQIFTSAMATARFLASQRPNGKAYVVGESGLTEAIHDIGYILSDMHPDYVVLGETYAYNFEQITKAIRLVMQGAKFIATNPDATGPSEFGIVPACGAMAALIEKATGMSPFFIGKPNPYMVRSALNHLGAHSENTVMIGDRMDTDILTGIESGMDTILVLSGVTRKEQACNFPYQPKYIFDSVAQIEL
jgi:NagD protein